jgi:hypothetical protein
VTDPVEVITRAIAPLLLKAPAGYGYSDAGGLARAALSALEAEGFTVVATARPPEPTTSDQAEQE